MRYGEDITRSGPRRESADTYFVPMSKEKLEEARRWVQLILSKSPSIPEWQYAKDYAEFIALIDKLTEQRDRPLASKLTFDKCCETCRFFDELMPGAVYQADSPKEARSGPAGYCRRYPPTTSVAVQTEDWCGEWEAQKTL